jgi:hypothetical protein
VQRAAKPRTSHDTGEQNAAPVSRMQRGLPYEPRHVVQQGVAPAAQRTLEDRGGRLQVRETSRAPTIRRQWDQADAPALTTLLKTVSGKDGDLVNALSDPEKETVKAYLENAATDIKAVKKLLHFGKKKERGETIDAAQRIEIRAKLLIFVAKGGTLTDAAVYRTTWLGHSVGHLGDLQPMASAAGTMEMVPMLGGLKVPAENEHLTQVQITQIRDVFDDVMQNVMYNSSAVPLDFMNEVRKAREVDPSAKVSDVFNTYAPGNDALTGAAGGADCVGMAALVKTRLTALGIGSHVIGTTSGNYLNQLPSHTRDRVAWQESKDYAIYSHASVVVPYLDPATDEPRAIHIETGMGPDPKRFKSFLTLAAASSGLSKYDTSTDVDPAELAKKHVKVKWRMYLSDSDGQTSKVFIDLISGSVFLSSRPVADVEGLQGLQDAGMFEGTSFNFENALKTPDKIVTLTTDEGDMDLSNKEATELFFQLVSQNFGLPDSFVKQMMYLAENIDEFRQEAMLDPITTIRSTWVKREEALVEEAAASAARSQPKERYEETRVLWTNAKVLMKDALAAVNSGAGPLATQKYNQAIDLYKSIVRGDSDPVE